MIAVLALGGFAPQVGDPVLRAFESLAARFAKKKAVTVCGIALAAILSRVALLPIFPVPVPMVHDEFSYLLSGDTFAHGRLTNPPHPMAAYFDTFHVLQHPTYQSMYPPAQGAAVALGILLGDPWIGVLLSMAAMCAALTWMLQGWFPPQWALLGGALAILRLDLCSYWTDSYWGGAVATMAAALVMGALPRMLHHRRARDAVILGIGVAVLANSRQFEGTVFCLPVAAVLIGWLVSQRGPSLKMALRGVVLPIGCVLGLTLLFMGYYNWRITGSVSTSPHMLDFRLYEAVPPFIWQKVLVGRHYSNPQFQSFYDMGVRNHTPPNWNLAHNIWNTCSMWWAFFLGYALSVPFMTLPWLLRDRRMRLPLAQFAICGAALMIVNWFEPHYAAPMAAALFLLLIQAMRHLRRWRISGRQVGIFLTRMVVLLAIIRLATATFEQARNPVMKWGTQRARIVTQLAGLPGDHLVIVRYAPDHIPGHEWVYNVADVDRSRIVWAREIPGQDLRPLFDYYHNRDVWLVDADAAPEEAKRLTPRPN
ncbi:MAG: hypothetical protein WCC95_19270 [Candidatus Sulfotelmatobacter sp.]